LFFQVFSPAVTFPKSTIPGHQQGARCKTTRSDEWGV